MSTYGVGRKTGVGFNHPRVLGKPADDWRKRYDFMRRLVRMGSTNRHRWKGLPLSASLVECLREYRK